MNIDFTYYNARVKTDYGAFITYHDITNLDKFLNYCIRNLSVEIIYFYRKQKRSDKNGVYCMFWTPNTGMRQKQGN